MANSTVFDVEQLRAENDRLASQVKRLIKTESQLYETQEQLDGQIRLYRQLYDLGKQFNSSFDSQRIFELTIEFVINELNFERCIIFTDRDGVYRPELWEGFYEEETETQIRNVQFQESELNLSTLCKNAEYLLHHPETPPNHKLANIAPQIFLEQFVLFPMQTKDGEITSFIIAGNTLENAEYYTRITPDSKAVLGLANLVSQANIALNNARLLTYLKEMDRLKDDFLANTSHELRTPLNGMIGIAESMIDGATGDLTANQKRNLLLIAQSGHRLANLVNDILDFAKLRHKDIQLKRSAIGLRQATEVVLSINQMMVGHKPLALINNIDDDLPPVYGDENRLQQILHNLVGNAIKFTAQGTIEVRASLGESDYITVTVSDTGIGIPAEKFERIFESFEQAEGSTSRQYGGTGLGLAVTKKLVELHGGKIWVESQVGIGSHFHFTMPISTTESTPIPTDIVSVRASYEIHLEPEPIPSYESVKEGVEILIVDDEPVNLQVLKNHLSLHNYRIVQATNGEEALALFNSNWKPDIVLLDVMMPKITGYEVTQRLRGLYPPTDLPIILLTAKTQVRDMVVGLELGANDYLTKPVAKEELLARLKTHTNLKKLQEEHLQLLQDYQRELETQVEERTKELSSALEQLQAAQNELIHSEKMAALGQLVAGIAHEVNTPLGAIRASITNISAAIKVTLAEFPRLFQSLPIDLQGPFLELMQELQRETTILSSREERQLRRHIIRELEEREYNNCDSLADTLVQMGIRSVLPVLPLLQYPDQDQLWEVASNFASQLQNSRNILLAVDRASKIVYALKSYARRDSIGQKVKASVIESIEIVLTIYHNQIKQGIDVIKIFSEVPDILCYPDDLNQVWTNLIHNAMQAMGGKGKLTIEVEQIDEHICIKVIDSGSGILPEVRDKIFEPFFTTKPMGEGSGLGLHIVKQIIDKHQGKITVESEPGCTCFIILLPILEE